MDKRIIRIEIPSSFAECMHKFWIGPKLGLVTDRALAIPVTHEEHLTVMSNIDTIATAYSEGDLYE